MALLRGIKASRERRDEKQKIILQFLKNEVVTTQEIVQELLSCRRQAAWKTLRGMELDGLILQHEFRTEIARKTIYGLTQHGAAMAHPPGADAPYFEPGRMGENTLAHDLWLQKIRIKAEAAGWKNWKNDKQIRRIVGQISKSGKGRSEWIRIPDGVAKNPAGEVVAVEVERTVKAPKRYSYIMSTYLQMIAKRTVERVHYVCVTPSVRDRVSAAFRTLRSVPVDGAQVAIDEKHQSKFDFFTIDEWLKQEQMQ